MGTHLNTHLITHPINATHIYKHKNSTHTVSLTPLPQSPVKHSQRQPQTSQWVHFEIVPTTVTQNPNHALNGFNTTSKIVYVI